MKIYGRNRHRALLERRGRWCLARNLVKLGLLPVNNWMGLGGCGEGRFPGRGANSRKARSFGYVWEQQVVLMWDKTDT